MKRLEISGWKSIREGAIDFEALNVLIGANGAGKSNLLSLFRFLRTILNQKLQVAVSKAGGAGDLLFFGTKQTQELGLSFDFAQNTYSLRLTADDDDAFFFSHESCTFEGIQGTKRVDLGAGHRESQLASHPSGIAGYAVAAMRGWQVYHFHDTGPTAKVKRKCDLDDNEQLHEDAGNLAAFLYRLHEKHPEHYAQIVDSVRLVAPFFDDFALAPDRLNEDKIQLEWRHRASEDTFRGKALSDGTLRFMCLATVLLQPGLPSTIILDEPELGLHPYAMQQLGALIRAAAARTQVVLATQSVTLLDQFALADILVVERDEEETSFRRPPATRLQQWLDDYSLGELWEKNVLGGRPG